MSPALTNATPISWTQTIGWGKRSVTSTTWTPNRLTRSNSKSHRPLVSQHHCYVRSLLEHVFDTPEV